MQPAIMIGSYGWDQDRVPRDELDIRLAELNRVMDTQGWAAMLIHGDAREHGALAYYTNFVPRLRWAVALVSRTGEPRILISMSARDVPAMRRTTWIADMRSGWDWERGFDPWLATLGDGPAQLGTLGFDAIEGRLYRAVERSIGNRFRLHGAETLLSRGGLRPRELVLTREAGNAVARAVGVTVAAWRDGAGAEAAMLAGERAARAVGAQDVRTLASFDGGKSLAPFRGVFAGKADPLVAYVAVKASGYWAELFITVSARPNALAERVAAGLATALATLRPRVEGRAVHAAAVAALGPLAPHPVLRASVGRRIGFGIDEGASLDAGSTRPIEVGGVYALHVGAIDGDRGALASAMVAITARGPEVLCSSAEAGA